MQNCPECSNPLLPGDRECGACGSRLERPAVAPKKKAPSQGIALDEMLMRGMSGLMVVLVLLAAAFTIYSLFKQFHTGAGM